MRLRWAIVPGGALTGSTRTPFEVIVEFAASPNAGKASRRPFADSDNWPFRPTLPGLTPASSTLPQRVVRPLRT